MKLHVSRQARDRYQFDPSLFASDGHIALTDFQAARALTQEINQQRDLAGLPPAEKTMTAGQLNAMGMLDEILHFVAGLYRQQRNPGDVPF